MSMSMYVTITSLIEDGGFDLEDMTEKINYYHVKGDLTTEQREQLTRYAREKAVEARGFEPNQEILNLWMEVRSLKERVAALESGPSGSSGSSGSGGEAEVSEFVQPTGAHDAYYIGSRVSFGGKVYESLINGNVWSPAVYPDGWKEV